MVIILLTKFYLSLIYSIRAINKRIGVRGSITFPSTPLGLVNENLQDLFYAKAIITFRLCLFFLSKVIRHFRSICPGDGYFNVSNKHRFCIGTMQFPEIYDIRAMDAHELVLW